MEFPTLDNSAKLAKCAENEALLARLTRKLNQDGIKPYQLPSDEFHAYIEAAIDAARVPWERGKQRGGIVDEPDIPDLDEPMAAPRRQRKRSLAKVCEAARKAGADRVIVDGVVIALSPSAAVSESGVNVNGWDAVLPGDDHGPH
jgi:hypothetical protein